ncbi:MAG: hypothetical protein IT562_17665 [Alphaproteobacteria bacterium]|nr:hypothetical protein [Alphaproteobacteria bacterium]
MKRLNRPPKLHAYLRALLLAVAMTAAALLAGVLGYRYFNGEAWIDALVDAAMILGGMGPVSELHGRGAKLFASFYALFSGLFLIGTAAVLLTPWLHHVLHKLHADEGEAK